MPTPIHIETNLSAFWSRSRLNALFAGPTARTPVITAAAAARLAVSVIKPSTDR